MYYLMWGMSRIGRNQEGAARVSKTQKEDANSKKIYKFNILKCLNKYHKSLYMLYIKQFKFSEMFKLKEGAHICPNSSGSGKISPF